MIRSNRFLPLVTAMTLFGYTNASANEAFVTDASNPGGTLIVIDMTANTVIDYIRSGKYSADHVAASPDGSKVYFTSADSTAQANQLSVIDTATNKITNTIVLPGTEDSFSDFVAINPTGTRAYITTAQPAPLQSLVDVVDTVSYKVIDSFYLPQGAEIGGLAISPDGTQGYVSDETGNSVLIFSTATDTITGSINTGENPGNLSAAHTPAGDRLYIPWTDSNAVSVVDAKTDKVITTISAGSPYAAAGNPDGTREYILGTPDGIDAVLYVIDTGSNRVVAEISSGLSSYSLDLAVDPDGSKVYITDEYASNNPGITIVDTATNKISGFIKTPDKNPFFMAVTPFPVSTTSSQR